MRNGIKIGRLFGINIYVDWSWLFIFALVTGNLGLGLLPELHPDWSETLIWGTAVAAALLFFASVLAHELAHSVVAQSRGMPVRNITLFLFGGVSNIQREPPSAGSEFFMAIVGPLTSLVLGVLFLLIAGIGVRSLGSAIADPFTAMSQMGPVPTLLLWLGPINIILGLFNLVPGFPLDGGRVLRSILWAVTGNLKQATRIASGIGQFIAWLMIAGGIAMVFGMSLPFFGTGLVSGLWLAFIGWFLHNASIQSYRQVLVEDMLDGVSVSQLMRSNAPTVTPEISVGTLVHDHIMGTDEQAFPVVEGDCLAGMVCLEDVRKVPREQWDTTRVRQIMTPAAELVVATPREEAAEALSQLAGRDVGQIPVVQDGHLLGMLRRRDIMRWLQLQSRFAGQHAH